MPLLYVFDENYPTACYSKDDMTKSTIASKDILIYEYLQRWSIFLKKPFSWEALIEELLSKTMPENELTMPMPSSTIVCLYMWYLIPLYVYKEAEIIITIYCGDFMIIDYLLYQSIYCGPARWVHWCHQRPG